MDADEDDRSLLRRSRSVERAGSDISLQNFERTPSGANSDSRHRARPVSPHGVPAEKSLCPLLDIVAVVASFVCLACAVVAIAWSPVAWRLAVGTNQLIAIGLLLSVMNLCLRYLMPSFFQHLEARFGPSTLQNYQAITVNSLVGAQISLVWRASILVCLALPIRLSIAYKNFDHGTTTLNVTQSNDGGTSGANTFGLFAPPGLQPLGTITGLTFMLNATSLVTAASRKNFEERLASPEWKYDSSKEPPLPTFPAPYGLNTLLLDEDRVAMLDIPHPAWLQSLQENAIEAESWEVSASVWATVVTSNSSIDDHRTDIANSSFWDDYDSPQQRLDVPLTNSATITLVQNWEGTDGTMDVTWALLGIVPAASKDKADLDLASFAAFAKLYDIKRQKCNATWTVSQAGAQLVDGLCDDDDPSSDDLGAQEIFTRSYRPPLDLSKVVLTENLGVYGGDRYESPWKNVLAMTTVAALRWGRVALDYGPGSTLYDESRFPGSHLNYTEPLASTQSHRSSLQQSPWLFFLLGLQPVASWAIVFGNLMLYSLPLGKGFSLIAVLAGFDNESSDRLKNAGFSGRVEKTMRLDVSVQTKDPHQSRVLYSLREDNGSGKERIKRGDKYG